MMYDKTRPLLAEAVRDTGPSAPVPPAKLAPRSDGHDW